jgi:hypothetical protein
VTPPSLNVSSARPLADRPDLTATPDERGGTGLRVVIRVSKDEDQEHLTLGASTSNVVIDNTGSRDQPMSECSCSRGWDQCLCEIYFYLQSVESTSSAREEEIEPAEASSGTYQHNCDIGSLSL